MKDLYRDIRKSKDCINEILMFIPEEYTIFIVLNKYINKAMKSNSVISQYLSLRKNTNKVSPAKSFYNSHLIALNKQGLLYVNNV